MNAALPDISSIRQPDTLRMIPSKYGDESVLARIADDPAQLQEIQDLDSITNDRLLAASGLLPGIDRAELVSGVAHSAIINAAFTHANPLGSRFNGPDRGAWYASFDLATAQAEVAFHKTVQLIEIKRLVDDVTYDVYLSDLAGEYHDLRDDPKFATCLDPQSYVASQTLAARLLQVQSVGIVYPSVRQVPDGTCIVCFWPHAVGHVRKRETYRFRWSGTETPTVTLDAKMA
ncbi:MAG: RES family NAD+ phosphorylase [Candidatus Eremiobacteraeota bacterium]|nr:RES family NAD+ phosphorylase [Candidatus Eremiobacteraeota bacterium]